MHASHLTDLLPSQRSPPDPSSTFIPAQPQNPTTAQQHFHSCFHASIYSVLSTFDTFVIRLGDEFEKKFPPLNLLKFIPAPWVPLFKLDLMRHQSLARSQDGGGQVALEQGLRTACFEEKCPGAFLWQLGSGVESLNDAMLHSAQMGGTMRTPAAQCTLTAYLEERAYPQIMLSLAMCCWCSLAPNHHLHDHISLSRKCKWSKCKWSASSSGGEHQLRRPERHAMGAPGQRSHHPPLREVLVKVRDQIRGSGFSALLPNPVWPVILYKR